ncbi:MAG: hypothetical protein K9L25_13370 [Methylovulum sp.]|nr:hypothetical protein [Methylovulum sp.]
MIKYFLFILGMMCMSLFSIDIASAASCDIAGYQYQIKTNNTSVGTLTINQDCLSGKLVFPSDRIDANVIRITIGTKGRYGSREISFMRNDGYTQLYTGWLSSNNKVIAGNLVNTSNSIPSLEKFPFFATRW